MSFLVLIIVILAGSLSEKEKMRKMAKVSLEIEP